MKSFLTLGPGCVDTLLKLSPSFVFGSFCLKNDPIIMTNSFFLPWADGHLTIFMKHGPILKPFSECGLYYKPITIVNYDSRIVNKLETSLTDDARVIIYDHDMFIVQATDPLSKLDKVCSSLTYSDNKLVCFPTCTTQKGSGLALKN